MDTIEDATRINQQGQIIFVVGFFLFQIIFWGVAMGEFIPEYKQTNSSYIKTHGFFPQEKD